MTLNWRLPATAGALRSGHIDLGRARLIADATAALDEETARAVEARVLPTAGDKTTAQLRAALRRAVIAADPQGAERRREEAERRARVTLYPEDEGTASLAGYSLPSVRAAAAMARITALANALKASGAGGGVDLLRAQVFLGLLLGTFSPTSRPPRAGHLTLRPPRAGHLTLRPMSRLTLRLTVSQISRAGGPTAGQPVRRRSGDASADGFRPPPNGRCGPRPSGGPPGRGDAFGSGGGQRRQGDRLMRKARRPAASLKIGHLISPAKGRPVISPAKGGHLISPAKGRPVISPAKGGHLISPAKGRPVISPAKGGHPTKRELTDHQTSWPARPPPS